MIEGRSDLPSNALVSRSGLGAGEADGFRRSTVEVLSSPFENEFAIRENDFALTVLENLDHHWFFDNITGFSLCGPSSSRGFLLASAAPEDSMRSIEMVNHGNRTEDDEMKLRNAIKLPRLSLQRTFSELQERERRLELEEREKEKEKDREREVNPPRTGHQRSRSDIMGGWDSRTVGIHYRLPSYDLTQKRVRFLDSAINPVQEITGTMLSSVKDVMEPYNIHETGS